MYSTNALYLRTYLLLQITTARASYTVQTLFLSYSNPEHRLANGSCCTESCGPCQVKFIICRRNHGTSVESSSCPGESVYYTGSTTEAENGSIIFNPLGDLFDGAYVFSPIAYNGPFWMVSICRNCYEIPAGARHDNFLSKQTLSKHVYIYIYTKMVS